MSIEKQLDQNYQIHKGEAETYFQNPDQVSQGDLMEFSKAVGRRHISSWARNQYMETSYNMAKKIIESIN